MGKYYKLSDLFKLSKCLFLIEDESNCDLI